MIWALVLFAAMVFAIFRMWGRRHGTPAVMHDPAFDKSEGHPQAAEALDLLMAGNWPALTALYGRLAPSDRYHLVYVMGEIAGGEAVAWPDDADSAILTIRAGMMMGQAWKTLKAGVSGAISRSSFRQTLSGHADASRLLADAAIRNPRDSTSIAFQLRMYALLGIDEQTLNALLGRLDASDETNVFAANNHVLLVSPAARGSIDMMWDAANEHASRAPNAAWLAIAARAHIEEWRYCMQDNTAMTRDYVARLQDDGFAQHIRALDRRFWARAQQGSMTRAEAHYAHNTFAFLLQIVRQDDLMAPHLEQIGPSISATPWSYLPDGAQRPTRLLAELRRKAGLDRLR